VVALGITVCSAYSGTIAGTFAGNAWKLDYVPGGSSQGSGVAPIARLAAACLGEETGGSIIFPAACNGASAIKPSLGLGSTAGVMPLSPSYDVIGPICRSGRDAALIMNSILGPDPDGDPQTTFAPIPFPEIPMVPRSGSRPLRGTTIGIHKKDWVTTPTGTKQNVDPQSLYAASHQQALARFIGELKALGAEVKEFDGADFLVFSEDENPYYNNPDVLQVIDGSNITASAAVINPNRYDIRYIEAVAEFAADKPDEQRTALLNQYGRRPGGATTGDRTFEAATAVLAGVSAAVRAEGERRRRQWAANYKRRFDEAGVDFMLVLTLGDKPALRATQSYAVRRNNQLANSLSFPMVSFPIGYADGMPINAEFKGPRFSEPMLAQAMVDYQARYPEHNRARPADPTPRPAPQRLSRQAAPGDEDPTLSNDPLVHEVVVA
jgi:Asp-tRNA(Asn)/Glu-tRNA(Gln) amidotransferase A subunit family amidase